MEKEINYLDTLKEKFDYCSMSKILTVLFRTNSNLSTSFKNNGKNYNIVRINTSISSSITMFCSDGREIYALLNPFINSIYISNKIFDHSSIDFDFYVSLKMCDDILLGECDGKYLKEALKNIRYLINNRNAFFNFIGMDKAKENIDDQEPHLLVTKNGIKVKNKYLISHDCEKIISIDDKEEIDTISQKIIRIYNEELPVYKSILEFMKILVNNDIKNYIFSYEEMHMFEEHLRNAYSTELQKFDRKAEKNKHLVKDIN